MPLTPPLPAPSGMPLALGARSHGSQWTNSPDGIIVLGTSGSSMISTSDCAFAGTPLNASAGLGAVWPASQVYLEGMLPPALNSGLEIVKVCADAVALHTRAAA